MGLITRSVLCVTLTLGGLFAPLARADTFTPSVNLDGLHATILPSEGLGLIAHGGVFAYVDGWLGIDSGPGDYNHWEINLREDISTGERFELVWARTVSNVSLSLAQFYPREDDCFSRLYPDCVPTTSWREWGVVSVNNQVPELFGAVSSDGRYALNIHGPVDRIWVSGIGQQSATDGWEFAVGSVSWQSIPEPALNLLIGFGLLAFLSRRHMAKAGQ